MKTELASPCPSKTNVAGTEPAPAIAITPGVMDPVNTMGFVRVEVAFIKLLYNANTSVAALTVVAFALTVAVEAEKPEIAPRLVPTLPP